MAQPGGFASRIFQKPKKHGFVIAQKAIECDFVGGLQLMHPPQHRSTLPAPIHAIADADHRVPGADLPEQPIQQVNAAMDVANHKKRGIRLRCAKGHWPPSCQTMFDPFQHSVPVRWLTSQSSDSDCCISIAGIFELPHNSWLLTKWANRSW